MIKLDKGVHCEDCQDIVYTVTYGQEVKHNLSYDKAAQKLGYAIMHSLQIDGLLEGE